MSEITVEIEKITLENAPSIYKTGGLKPYFEHIKAQVANEVPDLSTVAGQKRVASLANQVSRSKTAVEKVGRDYLRELKALPKLIEAELKSFVDQCDALRYEVRRPLTEMEQREAARLAKHSEMIKSYDGRASALIDADGSTADVELLVKQFDSEPLTDEYCQEFLSNYIEAKANAIAKLRAYYKAKRKQDEMEAELEMLRKQQAEAEAKAKQQAAIDAAIAEQKAIEEQRLAKVMAEAELAKQKAAEAIKAAEAAAEMERIRLQAAKDLEQAELERAAANKNHRAKVNREIVALLTAAGIDGDVAKKVITMAAKGEAGRLTVQY